MGIDSLPGLASGPAYALVGLFACLESAALVRVVISDETVMLLGGVGHQTGQPRRHDRGRRRRREIMGDFAGYGRGHAIGSRLRAGRLGCRVGERRWSRVQELVRRRRGLALLTSRWTGVLWALVPAAAGMVRMMIGNIPTGRVPIWNAAGGMTWVSALVRAGHAAGATT